MSWLCEKLKPRGEKPKSYLFFFAPILKKYLNDRLVELGGTSERHLLQSIYYLYKSHPIFL